MKELFPSIQPEVQEGGFPLYREAAWDFDAGKPVWRFGSPVWVTGKEAVKVWAWKALGTVRARYEIYSWDFGCELETLIGRTFSDELKQAEAARYVREALEINPYITGIPDIRVAFDGGRLKIGAVLETVYGEVRVDV